MHAAFRLARLDGFKAVDYLHKQRVFLHALLVGGLGAAAGKALYGYAKADQYRYGADGQKAHGSCNYAYEDDEDGEEGHINACKKRRGTEEVAQLLEFAQVVGKGSSGFRLVVQAHAEHLVHERARKDNVCVSASHIHEIDAHGTQGKVEDVGNEHAGGQNPECFHGRVGHHTVVHVHDKERSGHGNEVRHNACQGHVAVDGRVVAQNVPEPALAPGNGKRVCALVGLAFHRGKERIAAVLALQGLKGNVLGRIVRFRKDDLDVLALLAYKHAGAIVAQEQDAGKSQGRNVLEPWTVENATCKASLAGNAQAAFRCHMAAVEACHEKLWRDNDALETQENGHAAQYSRHEVHVGGP